MAASIKAVQVLRNKVRLPNMMLLVNPDDQPVVPNISASSAGRAAVNGSQAPIMSFCRFAPGVALHAALAWGWSSARSLQGSFLSTRQQH